MKTYIKVYWFLLVFFAVVSTSYCQTLSSQENIQVTNSNMDIEQQNNSNTDINQESNSGTDVNEQSNNETPLDQTLDVTGEIKTPDESPAIIKTESLTTSPTQENVDINSIDKAKVKGTRSPNEFPSGRSGGQYVNTGVKYPKITSPRELEKRTEAENSLSGNKSTAEKSSGKEKSSEKESREK